MIGNKTIAAKKNTRFRESLLDTFFPKVCVGCGKIDTFLCPKCHSKIVRIKSPLCLGCGRLSEKGRYCPRCKLKTKLNGVVIAAHYEEGPLKEAIHTYKYEFVYDLKNVLATFLADALKREGFNEKYILTYVPLHPKKENWRGFNQSKLLAEEVSNITGLELMENILKRKKNNPRQIELKRRKRFENVKDIFSVNEEIVDKISGKKIILADDIITTGATLGECAKVLKENGARQVWGLVLGKH
ncbi:hypothetical protein COY62_02795 [bacterium (Candidatus Howlettbacteria) CG_4_10_14_0_8_um_filter_40_9]|nr:MAG: hypothetical protein COY62_02795 [bacterium (Candidatus Howlettbacteria) CG_4_10_14_0_8_um_filter_40_9]